jgi:hypothetical protein
MDIAFYRNRANGCNVQFFHEDGGGLDEWSFNTREDAERVAAKLKIRNIAYTYSA